MAEEYAKKISEPPQSRCQVLDPLQAMIDERMRNGITATRLTQSCPMA